MRILAIDDEPAIGRMLARMLRAHDVVLATDPATVLQEVRTGAPFDVILCDLNMPGTDGRSVLAQVKACFGPDGPTLILMSGSHDIDRGMADATLAKPFTREQLDALVAASIELRAQRRRATTLRMPRMFGPAFSSLPHAAG